MNPSSGKKRRPRGPKDLVRRVLVATLLLVPAWGVRASAQSPVEPGSDVRLTLGHYQVTGVLVAWSGDTLRIRDGEGRSRAIHVRQVAAIEVGRFRSPAHRTLRGGAIGALLGSAAGAAVAAREGENLGPVVATGGGFGAVLGSIVGVASAGRSSARDGARGTVLGGIVGMASFVALALLDEDGSGANDVGAALLIGGGPGALLGLIVGLSMPEEPARWERVPPTVPRDCVETYWRYAACDSAGN